MMLLPHHPTEMLEPPAPAAGTWGFHVPPLSVLKTQLPPGPRGATAARALPEQPQGAAGFTG